MWQLLLLLLVFYISLLFIGYLRPQCVPRKLHPLLFIRNLLPEVTSSPSQELIPFDRSGASDPEVLQPIKYDVFISFRGVDVRNFFLSHLYSHLKDSKKLVVYKDDVDLERGEQISPALLLAIERSDVYIVILSPKYADSPWCLEELEKILQCTQRYRRRIIPVFYGVDPSDVENQKLLSSTPAGKIRSWRAALKEIANTSGFDSQIIRPENKLIEEIVKAVFQAIHSSSSSSNNSQMVEFSSYSASRGLVGVERKIEQVAALLYLGDRSNRTIGLWGMAGIGKTTLASAISDLLSSQFEASIYISNFADIAAGRQPLQPFGNQQRSFFSKLLGDDGVCGRASYYLTLNRLGRTKAFVVIDDVGNDVGDIGPLKDLLNRQYHDLFGAGSVIIMTSRNKQLLKSVCHDVYEVKPLYYEEACKLLCLHAFKGEDAPTEYLEMVGRAIVYTGGNPLAITILGARLFDRDPEFWGRELGALQDNQSSVVETVLRRSYDELNRAEKSVFLDLACFSTTWDLKKLERTENILSGGGKVNVITSLVDKSFITIGAGHIQMHIMVRDFGRNIVNEERQVGKCSRVWGVDVYHLFQGNKGTKYTEGIFLNDYAGFKGLAVHLQHNTFTRMKRLRFLFIWGFACNLILPEDGLECLPNALRLLVWHYFPSKYLPSQFSAENLILLNLQESNIEQLWESDELNVDLGNLKSLCLKECRSLRKLPNLSTARRLEDIDLYDCESLLELPASILDLPKLESLNVDHCKSLKLDNLEGNANSIQKQYTCRSDMLPNQRKLVISRTTIQKLPNSIIRWQILDLQCYRCTKLTEFPVIRSLKSLTLTSTLIPAMVELEKLTLLKHLNLSKNEQLVLISGDFSMLKSLQEIRLDGCSKLSRLPDSFGNLIRLSKLRLKGCKCLARLPDTIHKLLELDTLDLAGCDQLRHLPELPPCLKNLDAGSCRLLETLPISIVEKHDFTNANWCFANCWKLDPRVCSKLVDKFTQDLVRSFGDSSLVVPAICGSESGGEDRSTMGSNHSNNKTVVTAKLRGQPWKSKSTIFCAVLNSLDPLLTFRKRQDFYVECVMFNNKDRAETNVLHSNCQWILSQEYEDQKEDHFSKVNFLVRSSTSVPLVAGKNLDDCSTFKFSFLGGYRKSYGCETYKIDNMIRNSRVIPVYDDRVVTNEDEDKDDEESPNDLQGLYDQMCNHQLKYLLTKDR